MPELATPPALLVLAAALAYLLGSIPFGIVMARVFGLGDLRAIGSGGIGATNVLRTGNRLAALLTLLGDALKGGAAVALARAALGEDAGQIAGAAAFLGHCHPVWLGFRGGKGVATWFGTLLVLAWPLFLVAAATWLATAAVTRISSASALAAAIAVPLAAVVLAPEMLALTALLGAAIWWFHRGNVARLRAGIEPRIGRR